MNTHLFRMFFISVTLIAATLLTACSRQDDISSASQRREQAVRVVVEPVTTSSERTRVEAVGTSRALRSVTVHPATSGEVVTVNFKPGQLVKEGQILVELDQRDEKLTVELARVRLAEAERLYQRYQQSAASGATLPTTLDAAKTALDAARIDLDRAQVNLDDRTIKAPFSGYVGISDIDPGDRVQPTTAITTLDDRESLLVSFAVPELLIGKLKVGDPIAIASWSAVAATASGEVIDIDSRINPETRTFITRARVDNSDDSLRPGMSFRVTLDLQGDSFPVLPEVALQWGSDGSYVWSIIDDKAHRVPVSIVQRQEGQVLVKGNLDTGAVIVIEGIQRLRPGTSVVTEPAKIADDSSSRGPVEQDGNSKNPS